MASNKDEEKALVFQDRLERIWSLEAGTCPQNMVERLCRESAILWADTNSSEEFLFLIQAAQVYSFATTDVKDAGGQTVKKWQITQIPDENGVLPDRAGSWRRVSSSTWTATCSWPITPSSTCRTASIRFGWPDSAN